MVWQRSNTSKTLLIAESAQTVKEKADATLSASDDGRADNDTSNTVKEETTNASSYVPPVINSAQKVKEKGDETLPASDDADNDNSNAVKEETAKDSSHVSPVIEVSGKGDSEVMIVSSSTGIAEENMSSKNPVIGGWLGSTKSKSFSDLTEAEKWNLFFQQKVTVARTYLTEQSEKLRARAQEGPLPLSIFAFFGGCAMVAVNSFQLLYHLFSLSFLGILMPIYCLAFGLMVCLLEGRMWACPTTSLPFIFSNARFLKYVWGRG